MAYQEYSRHSRNAEQKLRLSFISHAKQTFRRHGNYFLTKCVFQFIGGVEKRNYSLERLMAFRAREVIMAD